MEMKTKGLTVLVIMVAMCALVASASAPPTPFMIYGYVSYENDTACNNPTVNKITNLNTNNEYSESVETNASYSYYQLMLVNGTDVNASEILQFSVTSPDGSQSKVFNHTVTSEEINNGGIFNFNFTLTALTPGQQVWYLSSGGKPGGAPTANDGLTHKVDNLLHKDIGKKTGGDSSFYLNCTEVAWFYADTGAENGLSFGEYSWTIYIRTEAIEDDEVGHNLTVEICKLNKNTRDITVIADKTTRLNATTDAKHLWIITCEDNGSSTQNFSAGDWLAVRLSWDCSTDELRIYYEIEEHSNSYIKSPSSDPGYPVPELPTIILISTGLLTLAGYVWLTKRRR